MDYEDFQSDCWQQVLCEFQTLFLLILQGVLFPPDLPSFLTCMYWLVFWILEVNLLQSFAVLSVYLCPLCSCKLPWSPQTPNSISSTQRVCWAPFRLLLRVPWPGPSFKAENWKNHKAHPTCISSLKDHCPLMCHVHCLEILTYILFSFLVVSGSRLYLFPITPSQLETEVSGVNFHWRIFFFFSTLAASWETIYL